MKNHYKQKGNILIIFIITVASVALIYLYVTNRTQIPTPAPVTQIVGEAQIVITRSGFIPETIKVKRGTQVIWTNKDKMSAHQVISSELSSLDSEEPLNENDSFSYIFENAGMYTYQSKENTKFTGTVIVE